MIWIAAALVAGAVPLPCVSSATEAGGPKESKGEAAAISLFDGEDLGKWKSIAFGGEGDVHVAFDGALTLETGVPLTGVVWTGAKRELPTSGYEISLEAKKHHGDDFFCALTFPVKESHATFVCGGWGGSVVGVSSIGGRDASQNETTRSMRFQDGRWYRIRVRVTEDRLTGWIDDAQVFDVALEGKSIALRPGPIASCAPLGIASYLTRSSFRKIALRRLEK